MRIPIAVIMVQLVAVCLVGIEVAHADVAPPPEFQTCDDKAPGDFCSVGDIDCGECVERTCSRFDYSGGTPPATVEYDCLECVEADNCGCSVGSAARPGLGPLALVMALVAGIVWYRHRRR